MHQLRRAWRAGNESPTQDRARFDPWLEHFYGRRLAEIDAACASSVKADNYALFRDLDDDLWGMLLTQQYDSYPHIRKLLPAMPEPGLQELWNGASGLPLAIQSKDFYEKLRAAYRRYGACPLERAYILDFGCGWGRLTRYLARDVSPGRLYGCDPVEEVLEVCRADRVPATFARSDFLPDRVPFEECFDLAYAFSVFTHLSEAAHERALRALHKSLRSGGLLIVTIRPPSYLSLCERMRPVLEEISPHGDLLPTGARYLFVPHPSNPWQSPPASGGEVVYGETVVTLDYVRERWGSLFELLETGFLLTDPYQVMLTMKRI
jgi:SAM-dependent methyltransferase